MIQHHARSSKNHRILLGLSEVKDSTNGPEQRRLTRVVANACGFSARTEQNDLWHDDVMQFSCTWWAYTLLTFGFTNKQN